MTNHLVLTALLSMLGSGCLTAETPAESVATGESEIVAACTPTAEEIDVCQDGSNLFRQACRDLAADRQSQVDFARENLSLYTDPAAPALLAHAEKLLAAWYLTCDQLADALFGKCLDDDCAAPVEF